MSTDTNKPAPVAEPASEDCIDTALSTMQTALRAAWEGDYTKSARYVELTATRLEARDQHNPAKWLRIALEEMQGKRQPVAVHAMSVPAPAVDERTPDSGHLAAASNGSHGGARKAERVRALVNAGPFPGMSEAFDKHMGADCWTDPTYAPDASMWAAGWKAALKQRYAAVSPEADDQMKKD